MSYDPNYGPGYNPEQQPGGPPGYPPPPGYLPPGAPDPAAIAQRVQLPAIFLIVAGVLNILLSGFLFLRGFQVSATPVEDLEAQMAEMQQKMPGLFPPPEKGGPTAQDIKTQGPGSFYGWGGLVLVCGLVTALGGARMLVLKSYSLAVFGSILAAVPCISCTACCGLGEGVGLWALIVLLNREVRSAFR